MLSQTTIKNILVQKARTSSVLSGISLIKKNRHAPVSENTVAEMIVVVIPGGMTGTQFQLGYPRVCVYVPWLKIVRNDGTEWYDMDDKRCGEIEDALHGLFKTLTVGTVGQEEYNYILDDITRDEDETTWSTIVGVRIRFEVINTELS
jgi:hypothetical protein